MGWEWPIEIFMVNKGDKAVAISDEAIADWAWSPNKGRGWESGTQAFASESRDREFMLLYPCNGNMPDIRVGHVQLNHSVGHYTFVITLDRKRSLKEWDAGWFRITLSNNILDGDIHAIQTVHVLGGSDGVGAISNRRSSEVEAGKAWIWDFEGRAMPGE